MNQLGILVQFNDKRRIFVAQWPTRQTIKHALKRRLNNLVNQIQFNILPAPLAA